MDWQTSFIRINLRVHWRLLISAALGASVSCPIWFLAFPFGYWFIKLWAGGVTGAAVGMILGTIWQLRDKARLPMTSGWFVLSGIGAGGLFAGISLFLFAPMMLGEETERSTVRTLNPAHISEILVIPQGREGRRLRDPQIIGAFIDLAKQAELFFPDHEGTMTSFKLTLTRDGGKPLDYEGRVTTGHPDDIALQFRAGIVLREILIPGGRNWLERAVR